MDKGVMVAWLAPRLIILIIIGSSSICYATTLSSIVEANLTFVADDSYEVYLNNVELTPLDLDAHPLSEQPNCTGGRYTRYCCGTAGNYSYNRCDFKNHSPDTYLRNISNGNVIGLRYCNSYPNMFNYNLINPALVCHDPFCNPSAFMAEVRPNDPQSFLGTLEVNWVCTPGFLNSSNINDDNNTSRNWAGPTILSDVPWETPCWAGYNNNHAWVNISNFNPDPKNITCYNYGAGDGYWQSVGTTTGQSQIHLGFTSEASWLYNVYNQSSFAYCRGTVSISFPAAALNLTSYFSFEGPRIVIETNNDDVVLMESSVISLSANQQINFTGQGCVDFNGNLSLTLPNSTMLNLNSTITPIVYNCRKSNSSFRNIRVVSESGSSIGSNGCRLGYNSIYGSKSLSLLFYPDCSSPPNNNNATTLNRNIIIGVVVGVGGCLILLFIGTLIGLVSTHLIRKKKRGRGIIAF